MTTSNANETEAVYHLPDLRYDYNALEPQISARIMELHHSKHHAAYVAGANRALEALRGARGSGDFSTLSMLEKNLAFNLSGHVLHSLFWDCLSPGGGGEPTGWIAEQLDADFGGFSPFREHMIEAASTIQGSGWALASWEPTSQRIVIEQAYDHQGNHGQGTVPILPIDAWEHAYYLQYENDKRSFFEAIWAIVDWPRVAARLDQASLGAT
ncbi:MAG: superoxide dismutase [Actinobacteria bacterium]|nr:superoxide dismutase [Actinomycetota bacterium]